MECNMCGVYNKIRDVDKDNVNLAIIILLPP